MRDPFLDQLMFFQQPERQEYVTAPTGGGEPPAPAPIRPKPVMRKPQAQSAPPRAPMPQGPGQEMPSPNEYDQMMSEILKEKRGSIEGIEEQLQTQQAGGHWSDKLNLAPLASYVDSQAGSNMASAMQGPNPEEQRQAVIAKLGDALQKQKDDYADTALNFFKNKAYMDQVKAQQENAASNRTFDRWYKRQKLGIDRAKLDKNKSGKELSQNMIRTLNEGNQIPMMLEDVRTALAANTGIMGPVEGRKNAMNPWHTESSTLDAQVRAVSQAFGRYMEGGVLRKEDEEKYRKMFPNSTDTPEVAANKLLIVERLLKQRQAGDLEAFRAQGYDLTGLDKGFEIPDLPGVLGGMQRPMSDDELSNLSDEELEAFINGQ